MNMFEEMHAVFKVARTCSVDMVAGTCSMDRKTCFKVHRPNSMGPRTYSITVHAACYTPQNIFSGSWSITCAL